MSHAGYNILKLPMVENSKMWIVRPINVLLFDESNMLCELGITIIILVIFWPK
jgi:hypothetical protein